MMRDEEILSRINATFGSVQGMRTAISNEVGRMTGWCSHAHEDRADVKARAIRELSFKAWRGDRDSLSIGAIRGAMHYHSV